jgi:hypothetical protein
MLPVFLDVDPLGGAVVGIRSKMRLLPVTKSRKINITTGLD